MTLETKMAQKAKELVTPVRAPADDREHKEETAYRSTCESFPILLRTCGLAQTVAFLDAKAKTHSEFAKLSDHVTQQFRNLGMLDANKPLRDKVTALTITEYRFYTEMLLRIAVWHKRLAQALLRKKGD